MMSSDKANRFFQHLARASKKLEESGKRREDVEEHLKKVRDTKDKRGFNKELNQLEDSVLHVLGRRDITESKPEDRLKTEKLQSELDRLKEKYDKNIEENEDRVRQLEKRLKLYSEKFKQQEIEEESIDDSPSMRRKIELLERKYMRLKRSSNYSDEELEPIRERIEKAKEKLNGISSEKEIKEDKEREDIPVPLTDLKPKPESTIVKPEEPWVKPPHLQVPTMPHLGPKPEIKGPLPDLDKGDEILPPEPEKSKGFFSKLFKKKKD